MRKVSNAPVAVGAARLHVLSFFLMLIEEFKSESKSKSNQITKAIAFSAVKHAITLCSGSDQGGREREKALVGVTSVAKL